MIKEYSQNRSNVIMNFSVRYCSTPEELLNSDGFIKVLKKYLSLLAKKDASLLDRLNKIFDDVELEVMFLELFKLLIVLDKNDISKINARYKKLIDEKIDLFEFIEGFYNYWRSLERYAVIQVKDETQGIQNTNFLESNDSFSSLILSVYRRIEENLLGNNHNVYRQLTAGINAGLVLSRLNNELPTEYNKLQNIHFITQIVLSPPFIIYPKKNTRSGLFEEVYENPLDYIQVKEDHFFCYPAKVGESLTFVYFHRDFMNHGVSLCNLFELAKPEEYKDRKPDIVLVFGARLKDNKKETVFFHDKPNDLMVGYVSNTDEVDYFGYMKKMILTLHNVRMINHHNLPIHGAMVNVTLKTGRTANIAIIGDSGAGKSESLEAFRKLSDKYLKEIKIIFDDMGTFKIENNNVVGYGTEIGAFVRLDDLEMGYSFEQMDRAIFMNPHRINARLLLPVSSFDVISKGYVVDYLLYANNFENEKITLSLFDNKENAVQVFVKGMRKAKGTTSESGVVESYFANPFGPVQRQEQTDIIIDQVFTKLFDNNIPVGQIYTRLAVEGYEQKGPEKAAKQLFELIQNK